jgi:hypothetical protein
MRMASRYGHTWSSQYGDSAAGIAAAEWRSTLRGLSRDQLRAGFDADALRGSEFPPSSTRFRAMCLGVPTLAEVRPRFQKGSADPFVRLMWMYVDGFRFARADQDTADRMVGDAYALASRHVMEGGPLPPTPIAAIAKQPKEKKRAPAEVERAHMAQLASQFLSHGAGA